MNDILEIIVSNEIKFVKILDQEMDVFSSYT